MRIDWVSLVDFRSYRQLDWRPDPEVNLLTGPNGAGKTNLLESVAYLASLKSFRSAPDQALIADDADSAVIRVGLGGEERERLIEIEIPRTGQRRTQVDKTKLRRTADLLGVIRVVAFLPEDLDLVKRGPAYRRDLLDDIAVQLWPAAHLDQTEYERALRQRNAFLRQGYHDEADVVGLGLPSRPGRGSGDRPPLPRDRIARPDAGRGLRRDRRIGSACRLHLRPHVARRPGPGLGRGLRLPARSTPLKGVAASTTNEG